MQNINFFKIAILLFLLKLQILAQVSINNDGALPASNSVLDVSSTTKGVLLPRMNSQQRLGLTPSQGLTVFDINTNSYWYHTGIAWQEMSTGANIWSKNGNGTYLDNLTEKVGIGTSSPTSKLTVKETNGTGTSVIEVDGLAGAVLRLSQNGKSQWDIVNTLNNNFQIYKNNGTGFGNRFFIDDSNGYVGIGGANNPNAPLTIVHPTQASCLFQTNNSGKEPKDGLFVGMNSLGNGYLWNYEDGELKFGTNDIERMKINAAGVVTIGGKGLAMSANGTPLKIFRYGFSASSNSLAVGNTLTTAFCTWTENFTDATVVVGQVNSSTATGEWYKLLVVPTEVDVINKRCKFLLTNTGNAPIAFNANWDIVIMGN